MAKERTSSKVQALHPTLLDDEKMSPYLDELSFVFSDTQVTNIAISGPYGAGKSTIVDTWEHREHEKTKDTKKDLQPWVHISLAEFTSEDGAKVPAENKEEQCVLHERCRDIESELINQLIFKLQTGNAPKSRFNITEDSSRLMDIGKAIFTAITIGLTVALILGWGNSCLPWTRGIAATILPAAWLVCVVLIVEGPVGRTQKMADDEGRKVRRVLSTVPLHVVNVGPGEGQTRLLDLARTLRKLPTKPTRLTDNEIAQVSKRLSSLSSKGLPIPKGIDPMRARPDRRALRGR